MEKQNIYQIKITVKNKTLTFGYHNYYLDPNYVIILAEDGKTAVYPQNIVQEIVADTLPSVPAHSHSDNKNQ